MGRAKLRMELISNEKPRRSTFEKRKKGLEKKASELSTLCGVKIGMIMYEPSMNNRANEPMIWPNNHDELAYLIDSYKSKSGHDCRYRTYSVSAFFKDQTEKVEAEFEKVNKKMKEVKYPKWDERYNSLSQEELKEFGDVLSTKIDVLRERINLIKDSRRVNFTESGVLMNPSVQENALFMPTSSNMGSEQQHMIQWQQPLAYDDSQSFFPNQSNWIMPMNVGNLQMHSRFNFHEDFNNYMNFPLQNLGSMQNVCMPKTKSVMHDGALLTNVIPGVAKAERQMYDFAPSMMPETQNRHGSLYDMVNFGM